MATQTEIKMEAPKRDLYKDLKGARVEIPTIDFVQSIFDLCDQYLKSKTLTEEQMQKVARLRSYIEINLKNL